MNKKANNAPGRPPLHPYPEMKLNEVNVREFFTEESRLNARCAAHMLAKRRGSKFDTVNSLSKTGKFVLTVKRIK